MHVSQLLAVKGHDVATIEQERSVAEAVAILKERGIGALVVIGDTAPLSGIVSERDVLRAMADHGASVLDLKVADIMTRDVVTCEEKTDVTELMTTMTDGRFRHVPVVQEGRLEGIISIGDVVKARLGELEHDKRYLLEYVSAR